jgi:hypothetical protein
VQQPGWQAAPSQRKQAAERHRQDIEAQFVKKPYLTT